MTTSTRALCVRCGRRSRYAETYLCSVCLDDPHARIEADVAERAGDDVLSRRRAAIERFRWAGGWGRE